MCCLVRSGTIKALKHALLSFSLNFILMLNVATVCAFTRRDGRYYKLGRNMVQERGNFSVSSPAQVGCGEECTSTSHNTLMPTF